MKCIREFVPLYFEATKKCSLYPVIIINIQRHSYPSIKFLKSTFSQTSFRTLLKFRAYFQQLGQQERQYRDAFLLLKGRRNESKWQGLVDEKLRSEGWSGVEWSALEHAAKLSEWKKKKLEVLARESENRGEKKAK